MARIWQTGFEHFDIASLSPGSFWGDCVISNDYGYLTGSVANAGLYLYTDNNVYAKAYITLDLGAAGVASDVYIRFLTKRSGDISHGSYVKFLDDAGGELIKWYYNGAIHILGVSQGSLGWSESWERIEVHIKIHDTDGLVEIRKNGALAFTYGPADTKSTGTYFKQIYWYLYPYSQHLRAIYLDDVAINDTVDDGRGNNAWCGSGKILGFRPISPPGLEQWTPVPAAGAYPDGNWARVDDGEPDDDTTYVASDTVGQVDAHVIEKLPAYAAGIRNGCVSWNARAKLSVAGSGQIRPYMTLDGSIVVGETKTLDETYRHYQQMLAHNPQGDDWTKTTFNNTFFGYEAVS